MNKQKIICGLFQAWDCEKTAVVWKPFHATVLLFPKKKVICSHETHRCIPCSSYLKLKHSLEDASKRKVKTFLVSNHQQADGRCRICSLALNSSSSPPPPLRWSGSKHVSIHTTSAEKHMGLHISCFLFSHTVVEKKKFLDTFTIFT